MNQDLGHIVKKEIKDQDVIDILKGLMKKTEKVRAIYHLYMLNYPSNPWLCGYMNNDIKDLIKTIKNNFIDALGSYTLNKKENFVEISLNGDRYRSSLFPFIKGRNRMRIFYKL